MASCCQRTPITLLLRAGLPERGLSWERARAPNAPAVAHAPHAAIKWPTLLAGQTWLQRAGAPQLARCDCRSCQSRGQSRGQSRRSRAVATCPFARRPPGPKWCPGDVQVASKSRPTRAEGRPAARRLRRGRWADCIGAAAKVTLAHAIVTSVGWNLWKGPQDSRSRALPNGLVWCSAATKCQRLH